VVEVFDDLSKNHPMFFLPFCSDLGRNFWHDLIRFFQVLEEVVVVELRNVDCFD
jgi:hypothetical protein